MAKETTHINSGIRKILENPFVFNSFNILIGAKGYMTSYCKKHYTSPSPVKMLDIGCGTADILNYLDENIMYYGFDFEESYINTAREKFGDKGSFFHEKVGQTLRSEWFGHFDLINAHGLLHHLNNEDSVTLLESANKYLKEGGHMVTVDTTYHDKQSALSKWVVSKDRGQNIRKPNEYIDLAHKYFNVKESYVTDNHIRIPYSIFTMVLTKK